MNFDPAAAAATENNVDVILRVDDDGLALEDNEENIPPDDVPLIDELLRQLRAIQHIQLRFHHLRHMQTYEGHDVITRKIVSNDPSLTKLEVGLQGAGMGYRPPGDDWGGFGRAVGVNTHLQELALYDVVSGGGIVHVPSTINKQYVLTFLRGAALNRSIQKLSLCGIDLSDVEILDILTPFFNGNQAF